MGFSSIKCKECGHPALCIDATNYINRWMNSVVAILPNDDLVKGFYDGYGNVGGTFVYGDPKNLPRLYHAECWVVAGKPLTHEGESSEWAEDQGWFFKEGAHDMRAPSSRKARRPGEKA